MYVKSILRKYKQTDSWFVARYGMNLYRGCAHDCSYCDGRAEGYHVDGEFGKDVAAKDNALEVLARELDPRRRRVRLKPSYVMLGGGVGDGYQPLEERRRLTRGVLQLLLDYGFPVHVLTKSVLVERDLDLLREVNHRTRVVVSFSFSTVDDPTAAVFEPGVPSPSRRLETIERITAAGVPCGVYLMPVIPFVSDTEEMIRLSVRKVTAAGARFVVFGGMTLKKGRQQRHFFDVLRSVRPDLIARYRAIYPDNPWGGPSSEYYQAVEQRFVRAARALRVPRRMPPELWMDLLEENDRVGVALRHLDYFLKSLGRSSPYGYAAHSVSKLTEPISTIKNRLTELKGVGPTTQRLIIEILEQGRCAYYERLSRA
jgi:DNA repair photolyase